MNNGNLRGAMPLTQETELHEVKVPPSVFQGVLNEVIKLYPVDHMIEIGDTFLISEATWAGSELGRSVYVKAAESYPFKKDIKKSFWKFWEKPALKFTTVVLLKLTGMMRVEGEDVAMSEPVKDMIYKNLDVDNVVDLKLFPKIVCVNDKNEVLFSVRFKECDIEKEKITELYYEIEKPNGNIHKYDMTHYNRIKKSGIIEERKS